MMFHGKHEHEATNDINVEVTWPASISVELTYRTRLLDESDPGKGTVIDIHLEICGAAQDIDV